MKAANDNNEKLNTDAIYAAMAWLREYAETPEAQAAYRDLLDREEGKATALRSMANEVGAVASILPVFSVSDEIIEGIYPAEPVSVTVGINLGRSVIWGSSKFAAAFLQGTSAEDAPIREALSRFIADRAN